MKGRYHELSVNFDHEVMYSVFFARTGQLKLN